MKAIFYYKNYTTGVDIKQERQGNTQKELDDWADTMFNSCNTIYGDRGSIASWMEIVDVIETRGYRDCM